MAAERKTKISERLHSGFKQLPGIHGKHGSSTQTKNVTEHPLSDLFGKYDGAIWDEIFVEIDADRQENTATARPQSPIDAAEEEIDADRQEQTAAPQ